jgi:hypothetical protein
VALFGLFSKTFPNDFSYRDFYKITLKAPPPPPWN